VRLTRETEYALRGLTALARRPLGTAVPLSGLAVDEKLPTSFLAKIFQKLARHGIVQARRGAGRGYTLTMAPEAVTVLEVIEAVEGSGYLDRCLFWGGYCGGSSPCLLHERWAGIKPQLQAVLEGTTIADLAVATRC
jgi:Rrf2 family iron-sulfur cluster assembly transcriptional regulator